MNKRKTRKHYLGGNWGNKGIPTTADGTPLAYPYDNIKTYPNPALAYTGKGGTTINSAYPSQGPPANGFNFLNPQVNQHGGCGCSLMGGTTQSGGKKCSLCSLNLFGKKLLGGGEGVNSHRTACKCSQCKKRRMTGGSPYLNQTNNGIPYPNGLTGNSWGPSPASWPGVNDVSGDRNYLAHNNYPTDVQTSIIDSNNSKPFNLNNNKVGGKRRKSRVKRHQLQKGGDFSNFLGQDLLNLGRQFQFGVGSAYNALAGYNAPVNPLPWKGQLPNTPSLMGVKASSL